MNYAGIGSRETPPDVLTLMAQLACELGDDGWTLRSGAASGADAAFESGLRLQHPREIFIPWTGFQGHASPLRPTPAAFELAARHHPAWARCSRGARALHARNCQQVLGATLQDPAAMVVCWTPRGSGSGGTGQALRIAKAFEIPIFDLGRGPEHVAHHVREFASTYQSAERPAP